MVENTVVLRPPRKGRTCVFGHVMGGFVERWLGIRICFSNGVYVSVGDTAMFSPPTGGVRGAYAIRPYTRYMPYIEIRKCFSNRVYILVGDTDMFSPPMGGVCGAYSMRPYTRYMPYMKIRTCFSNGEYVLVGGTDMFSEQGVCFG